MEMFQYDPTRVSCVSTRGHAEPRDGVTNGYTSGSYPARDAGRRPTRSRGYSPPPGNFMVDVIVRYANTPHLVQALEACGRR